MSLEQALAENTSALKQLIEVWSKLTAQAKVIDAKVAAGEIPSLTIAGEKRLVVEAPKPTEATPAPTPVAAVEATTASAVTAAESPSEPITYAVVSKAITDMVKTSKAKVIATLAEFGVTKGPQLTEAQYADFLKALAS